MYLNSSRLPQEREAEIKEIAVTDRVNAASSFSMRVSDPKGEWMENDDYYIGSAITIAMGYKDATSEIFSGDITAFSCRYRRGESTEVIVSGFNPIHRLARFKRNRAFSDTKVSDIIKNIADESSLSADVENLQYELPFFIQSGKSDYETLLDLAERYDCFFSVKDSKLSFKRLPPNKAEDVVIEYGKTLLEFCPAVETRKLFSEIEVLAWDPAKHETVSAASKHADIHAQGGKAVHDRFGGAKAVIVDPFLMDKKNADRLAADILARNNRDYITGEGSTYGNTAILAGSVIKAEGLGSKYSGKYFIVSATHRIRPLVGYKTDFSFTTCLGSQTQPGRDGGSPGAAVPAAAAAATKASPEEKQVPQIMNPKWMQDGKETDLVKVGTTVFLCADTKNIDDGTVVDVEVYPKDDTSEEAMIVRMSAYVSRNKVERVWKPVETRTNKKEEPKLDYVFKVTCNDASAQSGTLRVRNPEFVKVAFNKYAIYYGMEADLTIETFELAEFGKQATVEVWEKDDSSPDDYVETFYLQINEDEQTKTMKFDYPLDALTEFDEGDEYEFYVKIKIDELGIDYRQEQQILVALDYM